MPPNQPLSLRNPPPVVLMSPRVEFSLRGLGTVSGDSYHVLTAASQLLQISPSFHSALNFFRGSLFLSVADIFFRDESIYVML